MSPAVIDLSSSASPRIWSTQDMAQAPTGCWREVIPSFRDRLTELTEHDCGVQIGPDGMARAHGCARGRRPWTPGDNARDGPPGTGPPDPGRSGIAGFLASLNIAFEPIAKEECDHSHQEPQHDPSRKLAHLIRARNATCVAPDAARQP